MIAASACPAAPSPSREADAGGCHRFTVRGATESLDLPLRVLGLFAQRRLAPTSVRVRKRGDEVDIRIELAGLSDREAGILGARVGAIVGVTLLRVSGAPAR